MLGALSIDKRPGEQVSPTEERLIADLASQAGLVLRNAALIDDLRRSRQRLVAAQDEERRKIERNLHDGAQQQLVALAVQLKLARTLVDRDPARAGEMLDGLQGSATSALEDLRDLARGIYPPLLADKGLAAALDAQARKAAVPVTVDSAGARPLSPRGRVHAVFLRPRGAEQRREVRRGLGRPGAPRPGRRPRLVRGLRRRPRLRSRRDRLRDRACRAWPTGWPRSAGRSGSDPHPAPGQPSPGPSRWDRRRHDRSRTSGHHGDDLVTRRTASILAWGSCALSVLFVVLSIVVTARNAPTGPTAYGPDIALSVPATAGFGLVLLSFAVIGALIAVRRPDNGVGWLFCAIGLADSFFNLAGSVEAHGLVTNPGSMAGAAWFGLASDALWLPFIATTTVFLFLLFPEGRPVGRGRRIAAIAGVVAVAGATIGGVLEPHLYGLDHVLNPVPFRLSSGLSDAVIGPGYAVLIVVLLWSVWDLLRRLRRSTGEARLQLRWFVYAALLVLVVFVPSTLVPSAGFWWQLLGALALVALPVSVGDRDLEVPPLRHRCRDQQDGRLRHARRVHHAGVRRDRGRAGRPDRRREREPRPVDRRDRDRGRRVPTGARTRATRREPVRLRRAGDAVRGARAVQRARRGTVRDRGRPAADGPRDRRGHGSRTRRGVAPDRRRARRGRGVAHERRGSSRGPARRRGATSDSTARIAPFRSGTTTSCWVRSRSRNPPARSSPRPRTSS